MNGERPDFTENILPYVNDPSHLKYLDHPAFHEYIALQKTAVEPKALLNLGNELAQEYMPRYTAAAASIFAEVGLTDEARSSVERCRLIGRAEELWKVSIERGDVIAASEYAASFDEPESTYRHAVSLACTPLMKSIAVGNVTEVTRHGAMRNILSLAELVSDEISAYSAAGDKDTVSGFVGFAHELNALMALLYMDDPRYVPLPSTARADTGYYHREQSHDIVVVNQHWGTIKKIIPIEVKSRPSQRDRKRYNALLVRGKMHLSITGSDPRETIHAFARIQKGVADVGDSVSIERMSTAFREMLHLYNKGETVGGDVLRFYDSPALYTAYPEIAPKK